MSAPSTPREYDLPEHAPARKVYDHLRLSAESAKANVTNSSQSFEDIIGALPAYVAAVTVTVRATSGTVHVSPSGAANTSDPRLLAASSGSGESETFVGSKAELDAYRFITASGTVDCDFRVYVTKDPTD